jgi:hypothetical protein
VKEVVGALQSTWVVDDRAEGLLVPKRKLGKTIDRGFLKIVHQSN